MADALTPFLPPVQRWFRDTLGRPTPPQTEGWPAIRRGEHTLILAPTGSGKTLAAFLCGIDQLYRDLAEPQPAGVRLLYVSPLKALNNDVERNLRAPLEGIAAAAALAKAPLPEVRVAVRTGDTSAAARRQMLRKPPHILITTPESLYLMLTSPLARDIFRTVRTVIVDEIHTLCGEKRGVHLSLSLERLAHLTAAPVQRIGLSATIRPLEEVARFLGGQENSADGSKSPRPVTIVDAGYRKPLDLRVITAVDDFGEMPGGTIWPSLVPRVLNEIMTHRSTLIFTNSRRIAERTADRLNVQLEAEQSEEIEPGSTEALAPGGVARDGGMFTVGANGPIRAHHGSMSKEARRSMEEDLKEGALPALVGTSSLELGIDIGFIDLVVQVQSPKSVAQGLQRVGRSGHLVGQTSVGHIYPLFREDLVEAAAVARGMLEGDVELTHTPQNPLDVLAQQIVAMVAVEDWQAAALHQLVRGAYAYRDLTRGSFDLVLEMLAGKYHDVGAQLRARIGWDRINDRLSALPGSRLLALSNGGTITDRGAYGVYLGDGKTKIGELDEEFVFETKPGNTFLLGSQTWRVLDIQNDRVLVAGAAGSMVRMPFWRGDFPWRTYELGLRLGRFRREIAERIRAAGACDDPVAEWLRKEFRLDERSVTNLLAHVRAQLSSSGVISSDRLIVVESCEDALGARLWVIHSPFGGRINGAWALVIGSALQEHAGIDIETQTNDDGIMFRFPQREREPSLALLRMPPEEARARLLAALPDSAVFGAHFRMNASRALILPGARGGKRTPFWLQRLKAKDLLAVVRKFDDFPIVAETYRECLRDVLDLPHLEEVLANIQSGQIELAPIETYTPSPIAASLLKQFETIYQYEWDTPKAERALQALTLRQGVLEELLGEGGERLSELLKPQAITELVAQAQHLAAGTRARSAEELAQMLYELGDLTRAEIAQRTSSSGPPAVEPANPSAPFGEPVEPSALVAPFGEPAVSVGEPVEPPAPFGEPVELFGELVEPVGEPVEPSALVAPFGPPAVSVGEPVEPVEPVISVGELVEPLVPVGEPVEPVAPFGELVISVGEPVEPVAPANPASELVEPVAPANPASELVEPVEPVAPLGEPSKTVSEGTILVWGQNSTGLAPSASPQGDARPQALQARLCGSAPERSEAGQSPAPRPIVRLPPNANAPVVEPAAPFGEPVEPAHAWLAQLAAARRILEMQIPALPHPAVRWVHAELAQQYRDAFVGNVEAATELLRRFLRHAGPVTFDALHARYAFDPDMLRALLAQMLADKEVVLARISAGAQSDEYCARENLERIHRRTLSILRKEIQPVSPAAYTAFMLHWQHAHPSTRFTAADGVPKAVEQLRGVALPAAVWERDVLPLRVQPYPAAELDRLVLNGRLLWVAEGKELKRSRLRFLQRGEGSLFLAAPHEPPPELSEAARAIYDYLIAEGASFATDLEAGTRLPARALHDALIELLLAGQLTSDTMNTLRALLAHDGGGSARTERNPLETELAARMQQPAKISAVRYRAAKQRVRARLRQEPLDQRWEGRWSLLGRAAILGATTDPEERAARLAQLLLDRYGVVTRDCLALEELPVDWGALYAQLERKEMRGEVRRGYFVQGLAGAQFALPEALEDLRSAAGGRDEALLVISAADPANMLSLEYTLAPAATWLRFARTPSTHAVLQAGRPVLVAEDHGARINTAPDAPPDLLSRALRAWLARPNAERRVSVSEWNGAEVLGGAGEVLLHAEGFSRAPRGMEKWAK